jgi:hyaluronan synthase
VYFLTNEHDFSESDKKTIQVESPNQAASGQTIQPDLPESDKKTIQVESPSTTASEESIQREGKRSYQRISESGRIYVSKKGWLLRFTILALLIGITSYYTLYGITIGNTFVVYSNILLVYSVIIWVVGWFFFKSKITPVLNNGLVSVIIPIYNQKNMIKVVIETIYDSSYKNIEVVAVNDGSSDGTKEILDGLSKRFSNLKVIHQTNQGKRKAVAKGFQISKGKYIVLIDSDSVIAQNTIAHLVSTFTSNPKAGAISGHAKLWNANRKLLAKMQDTWYDYSFNIQRTTESVFGSVMCCPGCLSAYRRESISGFIRHWSSSNNDDGEYRMLTSYAYAPADVKTYISHDNVKLSNFTQKQMESAAEFDDADDRLLTAQSLSQEWQALYDPSAITYTEVPETWKGFLRQHLRWKKAYVRCSLFVSSFFWKTSTHPLMKFLFYIELMTVYTAPLIIAITYFYLPFIKGDLFAPIFYTIGILFVGFAQGLDYRCRDPGAKYWLLQMLMGVIQLFVQSGLVISALFVIKRNNWLTR